MRAFQVHGNIIHFIDDSAGRRWIELSELSYMHHRSPKEVWELFKSMRDEMKFREDYNVVIDHDINRKLIHLSESGYVLLTSSFNHPTDNQIKKEMINKYFHPDPIPKVSYLQKTIKLLKAEIELLEIKLKEVLNET